MPSTRTGVCAESQSCMSCGEVWKYQAILPVSTFTATSAQVNRLSPSPRAGGVGRRRIAGAEDVELGLGIVGAGNPGLRAAVARRVEACPGVEPGIARLHRHGVELPLQLAGFGIERLQEARRSRYRCRCRRARDCRRRSARASRSTAGRSRRSSLCQRSLPVLASSETR